MIRKLWRRAAAGALALCLLGTLSACGGGLTEKDAEAYIKGHLDAAYLGTYSKEYIDLVEDMSEAEAKQMHEENVSAEAQYLLDFLEVEYPSDEMTRRAEELTEKIYAKAKYTVGTGSKTKDGDFVVEVTVSPIELLSEISDDDFYDALEQSGYDSEASEEEKAAADAVFGMLMLDRVEELIPGISYGKDQIIMLQLKADDEGYYSLVDTGIQKVDEVMIDYFGSYLE